MTISDSSLSLAAPQSLPVMQRVGASLAALGALMILVATLSAQIKPTVPLVLSAAMLLTSGILFFLSRRRLTWQVIMLGVGGTTALALIKLKFPIPYALAIGVILFCLLVGAGIYHWDRFGRGPAGVRNNHITQSEATKKGGAVAWFLALVFTGFYVLLYWYPEHLEGLIRAMDPVSQALRGAAADQWFMYGLFYSLAIVVMGWRFILKYRHNRYQVVRTGSVTFFQLIIAFALPGILYGLNRQQSVEFKPVLSEYTAALHDYDSTYNHISELKQAGSTPTDSVTAILTQAQADADIKYQELLAFQDRIHDEKPKVKEVYFSYFWPLAKETFWPDNITDLKGSIPEGELYRPERDKVGYGSFGSAVLIYMLIISLVGVVILTYFFGKRWYCSWVCGCGGLAETAGDPFRHLSDKSLKAWRIERVLIHSVLVAITLITIVLLLEWQWPNTLPIGESVTNPMKKWYGFFIGSIFAGVIGVGFYPIMGSRVWCRFGCPQAAILGILQKWFSRFRITTNGGQCISCGNCSTHCEMGIDVKWYAQRGQNIVRASCVGCGICSAVCPRGVLRLESGPIKGKTEFYIDRDELKLLGDG